MTENGQITRDQLLSCKRRITSVDIPELGTVYIQSMTERERSLNEYNSYQRLNKGGKGAERDTFIRVRARAIQLCLVNANGERMFSDSDEHTEAILDMDARVSELITDAIEAHCGFTTPTEADHADLEKKSGTTPAVGSPT